MHIQFIKGKFTSLIESKRLELKKLAMLYPILHARKFMIIFLTFNQYRTLNIEQIIISIKKFKFYKLNNNLLKNAFANFVWFIILTDFFSHKKFYPYDIK